jgi:hypothetical protein
VASASDEGDCSVDSMDAGSVESDSIYYTAHSDFFDTTLDDVSCSSLAFGTDVFKYSHRFFIIGR